MFSLSFWNFSSCGGRNWPAIRTANCCPYTITLHALSSKPIKGRITVSGYEGSELLVARLLDQLTGAEAGVLLQQYQTALRAGADITVY